MNQAEERQQYEEREREMIKAWNVVTVVISEQKTEVFRWQLRLLLRLKLCFRRRMRSISCLATGQWWIKREKRVLGHRLYR